MTADLWLTSSVHMSAGNGGWVRVSHFGLLPEGTVAYVRFRTDEATDRLVPTELYLESVSGERLRGEHLRRFPLDVAEAYANGSGSGPLRERMDQPAPQLGILASYYGSRPPGHEDSQRPDWVKHSLWSQMEEWQEEWPPAPRRRYTPIMQQDAIAPAGPRLSPPPEGRYTDDWYRTLANAYNNAVGVWRQHGGEPPAKALAEQAGVSINTVRSWVYRARRAGFLPKGSQGRAG